MLPREMIYNEVERLCLTNKVNAAMSRDAAEAAQNRYDKGQFNKVQSMMKEVVAEYKKLGKEKKR